MCYRFTVGLSLALFAAVAQADGPEVSVTGGVIAGTSQDGVDAFKGIPFAAKPVGELRWQPPHPVKSWQGVRLAQNYGKDCMQEPFPGDAAPLGVGFSEDCLTINVWKPSKASGKLPVMVWIYGGGFVNGGSSPAVYAGDAFARKNVVFVSFNYRVGRFGFFAHPALSGDAQRGNYALMDQIAALKWVQNNITQFHGDPHNVTLFGESAGGFSVNSLLLTTQADGLFQKAIIQSGSGRHNMVPHQSWQQAEKAGITFAARHNITGSDEKALAALRRLSAAELVNGLNMATMQTPDYSGPMIDGRLITAEPQELYHKGLFNKVPLMVGANEADIGFAPQVRTLDQALTVFSEELRTKAHKSYAGMTPQEVANAIASDGFMVEPARFMARVWNDNQVPVWQYRFGYVAHSLREQMPAATHASEIPYVFNTLSARYGKDVTPEDQAVADQLNSYWVNFARNGNPAGEGLPLWIEFDQQKDNLLIVPISGAAHSKVRSDPWRDRLDLVETLVKE
ncbi:esterase [Klebsiella variicola]|uniref:carboxylesterase/lipase family protein n=1 Tax=Klebsiella variicola TaxID=244366 RepID=UPI00125985E2|nr:carboxylesterase family protein [Klebsiella variicola]VAT81473.1 esterase [Klebsiella variicola]